MGAVTDLSRDVIRSLLARYLFGRTVCITEILVTLIYKLGQRIFPIKLKKKRNMNILVTGACGYKGSVLVPKLLANGYSVVAVDTCGLGIFYRNTKLASTAQDVRNTENIPLDGVDAVIHLSSVANDPWEI